MNEAGELTDPQARADWIQSIAEAVQAAVVEFPATNVVHSRVGGQANAVIQYVARARVDTQRRRRTPG